MFIALTNTPRDYHWGGFGEISQALGRAATGRPEAEYWLGAHPGSPARIVGDGPDKTLDTWLAGHPEALAGTPRLPYLLKLLSAGAPLSLQVHPSLEQAISGWAREEAQGVPRDASTRNYRDDNHKPELIVALTDGFTALCGIRPEPERARVLDELGLDGELDASNVRQLFVDLLSARGTERLDDLLHRARSAAAALSESRYATSYRWLERLAEQYPGDPGVLLSTMLNLVELRAGEALFLPAGNLHAYLSGFGVELMAASDNVLRGGLTEKHIDVDELLAVTAWEALPVPRIEPTVSGGARVYRGSAPEFELVWIEGEAEVTLTGPAIALSLGEHGELRGDHGSAALARGDARFVTPDEQRLAVRGERIVLAQPRAQRPD